MMTGSLPRLLTLMGSGETAPTMVKVHRQLIDRLARSSKTSPTATTDAVSTAVSGAAANATTDIAAGAAAVAAVRAVVLDTPYGFQENAPELAQRAIEYFRASVGRPIEVAGLTRFHGCDPVQLEQGLTRVRRADYLFAGPGSPTYSLRQWAGSDVPGVIADKLRHGGAVTFASAAALTLGRVTVPVYEIYKAGDDPYWLDGLDVLATVGLPVAVIPHYDNAEGGHHDTRFCYLGERRLRLLEDQLPAGTHVLGIDEHTGVILDLDAGTATVVGNGAVTVRVRGTSTLYPTGCVVPIEALGSPGVSLRPRPTGGGTNPASPAIGDDGPFAEAPVAGVNTDGRGAGLPGPGPASEAVAGSSAAPMVASLAAEAATFEAAFAAALASGDADAAVRAALGLETAIRAWSADTLQSSETDRAHGTLRSMILRLGEAAEHGLADPRTSITPFVELIADLRAAVRADRRYDLSDLIRDRLSTAGVELRDTPDGPQWTLRSPSTPA